MQKMSTGLQTIMQVEHHLLKCLGPEVFQIWLFLEFGYLQIPNEGGMGPKSKHEIHVSYIPTHTAWR